MPVLRRCEHFQFGIGKLSDARVIGVIVNLRADGAQAGEQCLAERFARREIAFEIEMHGVVIDRLHDASLSRSFPGSMPLLDYPYAQASESFHYSPNGCIPPYASGPSGACASNPLGCCVCLTCRGAFCASAQLSIIALSCAERARAGKCAGSHHMLAAATRLSRAFRP